MHFRLPRELEQGFRIKKYTALDILRSQVAHPPLVSPEHFCFYTFGYNVHYGSCLLSSLGLLRLVASRMVTLEPRKEHFCSSNNPGNLLSLPCRSSLNACGVCRIPYQQEHAMLRHRWLLEASAAVLNLTILPCNWRILRKCSPRYAEKDHQQLVELRSQRDALQEKLVSGDRAQVDGEQIQVRAQVYQEERSIVPEEVKVLTEGIDF